MSESEIKTEIKELIEVESDLNVLKKIKNILTEANELESALKRKLISRALKAKEDAEKDRTFTKEEVEKRLEHIFKD